MSVTIQDVLKANVVLVGVGLLNYPDEVERFRSAVDTDVSVTGSGFILDAQSSIAQPGRTLNLNRDRIVLELSQVRSSIEREYPSEEDLGRLAEVARHAISATELEGTSPRAFGYNIELIYDQDSGQSAFSYLAERLFTDNLFLDLGWQLSGGTGKLMFDMDGKRCNVTVEPRFNDVAATKVFFSLNLHHDEQRIPNGDEIKDSLREIWDQAHIFANHLDEGR